MPGDIPWTTTPLPWHSLLRVRMSWGRPALEKPYVAKDGVVMPSEPAPSMRNKCPPPEADIVAMASRDTRSDPRQLTRRTDSMSAAGVSVSGAFTG